ncbi:MAG: TraB/GumN family protein [Rhizomicrobium sp.]
MFAGFRMMFCAAIAALIATALPANAAATVAPAPVLAPIEAHPALWLVRSDRSLLYLFGSIHLLPPNVDWHSPAVDKALKASDVFVFEAPLGEEGLRATQDFVRANGMLPTNRSLSSQLDPKARRAYLSVVAASHVPPESLAHLRPWLAEIVLETRLMENMHYSPDSGVDRQIWKYAKSENRKIESLETVGEQLSLLMPKNPGLETEEFDASLKELKTDSIQIGALVDAWCNGRVDEVARMTNAGLSGTPGAMKLLITDRNARWTDKLAGMLARRHTYFVTVGAGHLAGPESVPALLARRGYRVTRLTGHG